MGIQSLLITRSVNMFLILSVFALVSLIVFCLWYLNYWKRRNVDGPSALPLVGNMSEYILGKTHFGLVYDKIYNQYRRAKYVGIFKFTQPTLLIRDLGVINDVLVRQLSAFEQNEFFVDEKKDPLLVQSPFVQIGEEWKKTRSMLTPIFTPGRVKQLYPIVEDTVEKLKEYIESNLNTDLEGKNLCFKYAMENVASCAFGLNANCFTDPNSDFFVMGSNVFAPNLLFTITTLFFPGLTKLINVPFVPSKMDQWLRVIVEKVLEARRCAGAENIRNDFLQFIVDLKEKRPEDFTKDTIVGHCLTFLTEGTETSSITMTYVLYELAKHPEVQEKIYKEIMEVTENGKNQLNGDLIGQLKYMDRVIDESIRLHSPVFSLNKICTKRTEIVGQYEDNKTGPLIVEEGTRVVIPVYSILRDPNHFVNPEQFDPERFTRDNIPRMAMLGFGEGGRICLGKNFALFQIKMALATIVKNFRVIMSDKMNNSPPKISHSAFMLHCDEGVWIQFKRR